jgi:foldase protein PrsA
MARRIKKRDPNKPMPKAVQHRRKNEEQQRRVLIGAVIVIAVVVSILGFGYYQVNFAAARAPVAVVNGEPITIRDYQQMVKYQRFNLINTFGSQVNQQALVNFLENQIPQIVLDSLIEQVFIKQKAAEEGIVVTDDEVQTAIEKQFGFSGAAVTPTPAAGEAVTDTVTAEPVTREQFDEAFRNFLTTLNQETGLSEAEYREIVRGELLRDKVSEPVGADVPTTETQVHARHILVETEEEAQAVRQRLLDGEDFAQVAEAVSKDTGSVPKGGDLGWFGKGDMVPEFEEVAFSLAIGEISEPVKSEFGYHIIEVLEQAENRELGPAELDQARQTRFRQWLDEQRAAANIQRFLTPDMVPELPAALSNLQPPPPLPPTPASTPSP